MVKKALSIIKRESLRTKPQQLTKKQPHKTPFVPNIAKPAGGQPQKRAAAATASADADSGKPEAKQQPDDWVPHSAVVRQAAGAVAKLLASDESRRGGRSIKSLTLAPHIKEKKATFALTCQTLRYLPVLQKVIESVDLLGRHPKLTAPVAYVLCYEVLFGQTFKPTGPAEHTMVHEKARLREQLQIVIKTAGAKAAEDLLPEALKREDAPRARTVRVNTLKTSVDDVLEWLADPPQEQQQHAAKAGAVQADELLPDVLAFPPGSDLHDHPLVATRSLILQSRSSCMAAHALHPARGAHVVDCCAAPGNKTTHLAALLGGEGRVDAFELDPKRAAALQANLDACGAASVTVHQGDFLEADPAVAEFADVTAALLDPSCSGSGTTHSRMDYLLPSHWQGGAAQAEGERLEKLAQFQEAALRHALRFPALERLVYSTCSVHDRENEAVVAAVLPDARQLGFRLKDPFPAWPRRGRPLLKGADKLVRVDPELDGTDGFFIALFVRSAADAAAAAAAAAEESAQATEEAAALLSAEAEPGAVVGRKAKNRTAAATAAAESKPSKQAETAAAAAGKSPARKAKARAASGMASKSAGKKKRQKSASS